MICVKDRFIYYLHCSPWVIVRGLWKIEPQNGVNANQRWDKKIVDFCLICFTPSIPQSGAKWEQRGSSGLIFLLLVSVTRAGDNLTPHPFLIVGSVPRIYRICTWIPPPVFSFSPCQGLICPSPKSSPEVVDQPPLSNNSEAGNPVRSMKQFNSAAYFGYGNWREGNLKWKW